VRAILLRELGSLGTRHALFVVRLVLLCLLAIVLGFAIYGSLWSGMGGGMTFRQMSDLGHTFFITFFVTELILVWLLVASMTGGVIATEREQRTLDLLLMAPPGPMRILFGKFLSRIAVLLFVIAYSSPFLFAGLALGGVGTDEMWKATVHVIAHGVLACGVTFLLSATNRNPRNASGGTIMLIFLGAILLPFLEGIIGAVTGVRPSMLLTAYVHPFYASIGMMTGAFKLWEWEWILPAIWIAVGVGAALLAGRIVAIRTYVNPPEHLNPRTRTKRKGLESIAAVGRLLALVAAFVLGLWLAFAPKEYFFRNHLPDRPLLSMAIAVLFVVVLLRRARAGLTQGEARAWSTSLPPGINPMQWKEANFVGFLPRWRADLTVIACLLIVLAVTRESGSYADDELIGTVMGCTVVVTLLFVLSQLSVGIARERERKTLELLLLTTAPRRMLVDSGWAAIVRMMWPLLALLAVASVAALIEESYKVHTLQLLLAWAILGATIVLHGYWALWASFRAKKSNSALSLGFGVPLLAYTVPWILEVMFMSFARMGSNDFPTSLAINPVFLTIYLSSADKPRELGLGLPIVAAGVLYMIGALVCAFLLRASVLARMESAQDR